MVWAGLRDQRQWELNWLGLDEVVINSCHFQTSSPEWATATAHHPDKIQEPILAENQRDGMEWESGKASKNVRGLSRFYNGIEIGTPSQRRSSRDGSPRGLYLTNIWSVTKDTLELLHNYLGLKEFVQFDEESKKCRVALLKECPYHISYIAYENHGIEALRDVNVVQYLIKEQNLPLVTFGEEKGIFDNCDD